MEIGTVGGFAFFVEGTVVVGGVAALLVPVAWVTGEVPMRVLGLN